MPTVAAHRPLDALINLAVVLNRAGRYEAAGRACLTVLAHSPHHPQAWVHLGHAYKGAGRLAHAKAALIEAWDLPVARFHLGCLHLLEDDLARGLPLYEERKALFAIGKDLAAPERDGARMPGGTLLVEQEQGLGDTLLMCRFYPELLRRVDRVVAHVQQPLARLVAAAFPGIEVVTDAAAIRYDAWCGHMSLPLRLGITNVDRIPVAPWLGTSMPRTARTRPRVGLNWAGDPSCPQDFHRSTHLEELSELLQVTDVEWCSLHRGHLQHEAERFGLPQPLARARDFLDTARVIGDLDLVISTEGVVPNLSAAMGVRTCVLAGPDADWRWRSWYAAVSVCAQDEPGDWSGAVAKALEVMRAELAVTA